jgi:hypothetical protein
MDAFIGKDFLLENDFSRELYHISAQDRPIIDYHCHLSPKEIAEDHRFADISELWLGGDHYKWRAMRAVGVEEKYITGDAPAWDKFRKWAAVVPYLMRNPLYHWTHLELARVFGIYEILNPETARGIFDRCNEMLASPEFSARNLILKFNVETLCTTDDPIDSLEYHKKTGASGFGTKVLPAWRPDKAVAIEAAGFREYIGKLSDASGISIRGYGDLLQALQKRHDFFEEAGCVLSDHGLDTFYAYECRPEEADRIFRSAIAGNSISEDDAGKYKTSLLLDLARMDAVSGWVQQFHIGPIRNNFTKMFNAIGPDTGYDAIGDKPVAEAGFRFFDILASEDKLAKTIIYNLNPKDSEVMAAMAMTFNDGGVKGKIQYGAAWWFLDQEDGIRKQLNAVSSLGVLRNFVGMLTDSRSFISYPRHEYFRRILCNMLGEDLAAGKLPVSELPEIHQMVKDICYNNAKSYFGF